MVDEGRPTVVQLHHVVVGQKGRRQDLLIGGDLVAVVLGPDRAKDAAGRAVAEPGHQAVALPPLRDHVLRGQRQVTLELGGVDPSLLEQGRAGEAQGLELLVEDGVGHGGAVDARVLLAVLVVVEQHRRGLQHAAAPALVAAVVLVGHRLGQDAVEHGRVVVVDRDPTDVDLGLEVQAAADAVVAVLGDLAVAVLVPVARQLGVVVVSGRDHGVVGVVLHGVDQLHRDARAPRIRVADQQHVLQVERLVVLLQPAPDPLGIAILGADGDGGQLGVAHGDDLEAPHLLVLGEGRQLLAGLAQHVGDDDGVARGAGGIEQRTVAAVPVEGLALVLQPAEVRGQLRVVGEGRCVGHEAVADGHLGVALEQQLLAAVAVAQRRVAQVQHLEAAAVADPAPDHRLRREDPRGEGVQVPARQHGLGLGAPAQPRRLTGD